jgi:hypothetical protein
VVEVVGVVIVVVVVGVVIVVVIVIVVVVVIVGVVVFVILQKYSIKIGIAPWTETFYNLFNIFQYL